MTKFAVRVNLKCPYHKITIINTVAKTFGGDGYAYSIDCRIGFVIIYLSKLTKLYIY